jgi:hypothetical protein
MTRLIDADAFAKKAYDVAYPIIHGWNEHELGLSIFGIAQLLDDAPTVDAVPVRHGKWIFGSTLGHSWMKCSECCVSQDGQTLCFSYCPNCGARMDEE